MFQSVLSQLSFSKKDFGKLSLGILFLFSFGFILVRFGSIKPDTREPIVQEWNQGWEYRWLPSGPNVETDFSHLIQEEKAEWLPYSIGIDLRGTVEGANLLIRNKIPDTLPVQPSLLVYALDLTFRVFIDGELRYSRGKIPILKGTDFPGLVRHEMIPLEPKDVGKQVLFLVHSNWIHIGFSNFVLIGNTADIVFYIFKNFDFFFIFAAILSFISGASGLGFAKLTRSKTLFFLSTYLISVSFFLFYGSHFISVLINKPALMSAIGEPVMLICILTFICFIESIPNIRYRPLYSFQIIPITLLTVIAFLYSAFLKLDINFQNWIGIPSFYVMTFNLIIMPISIFSSKGEKTKTVYLLMLAITCIFAGVFPQSLWEMRLIEQMPDIYYHFSLLGFILCLSGIISLHIKEYYLILRNSKEILQLELKTKKEELEKEQEEKITLARTIAIQTERAAILGDLHDEIGQKALDIHFLCKSIMIQDLKNLNPSNLEKIQEMSQSLLLSVRSRFHSRDDLEMIERDFVIGIHSFLLHRYELYQRRIVISNSRVLEIHSRDKLFAQAFLQILREISNNDLKYGSKEAIAKLSFASLDSQIQIQFESDTTFDSNINLRLEEKRSLFVRIKALKGEIKEKQTGTKYSLSIALPV